MKRLLLILIILLSFSPVLAENFTQGYASDQKIARGSIVTLEQEKVRLAEPGDPILGVAIRSNDTSVTIGQDSSGIFVADTGNFEVLVSNIDGDILSGDYLSISAIEGVAKKATRSDSEVIGRALVDLDFSDPNNVLPTTSVEDSSGNAVAVKLSRVQVDIKIEENPQAKSNQLLPDFIVNFSETIAGKPVPPIRIYFSIGILAIATAISASLLYSSVKNSLVAIGRNPLSKRSVLVGLTQVIFISATIFISGLVAVYLVLRI